MTKTTVTLEKKVAETLRVKRRSLAVSESCSGGLLSHRLTNIPGSSQWFVCGIVAYSNQVKRSVLKIPPSVLTKHGAVSEPVAKTMALHVRKIFRADYGIGITGIAGPGGGSKTKPVGLVCIAVSGRKTGVCQVFQFRGKRQSIKNQSCRKALQILLDFIHEQ